MLILPSREMLGNQVPIPSTFTALPERQYSRMQNLSSLSVMLTEPSTRLVAWESLRMSSAFWTVLPCSILGRKRLMISILCVMMQYHLFSLSILSLQFDRRRPDAHRPGFDCDDIIAVSYT